VLRDPQDLLDDGVALSKVAINLAPALNDFAAASRPQLAPDLVAPSSSTASVT
jgi:hypothetical protein